LPYLIVALSQMLLSRQAIRQSWLCNLRVQKHEFGDWFYAIFNHFLFFFFRACFLTRVPVDAVDASWDASRIKNLSYIVLQMRTDDSWVASGLSSASLDALKRSQSRRFSTISMMKKQCLKKLVGHHQGGPLKIRDRQGWKVRYNIGSSTSPCFSSLFLKLVLLNFDRKNSCS